MFGLFNRSPAAYRVSCPDGTVVFQVAPGTTLLDAAERAGVAFPASCRAGSCGTCRVRVVSGRVVERTDPAYVLSAAELAGGWRLGCQTVARSDLVVDLPRTTRFAATVTALDWPAPTVARLVVGTTSPFRYAPGQYVWLTVPGIAERRAFSLAGDCGPDGETTLEFHVRLYPDGRFGRWLHEADRRGASIQVEGPAGNFRLPETPGTDLVAIAGGTGWAPMDAVLRQAIRLGRREPLTILYGARDRADLYCADRIAAVARDWTGPATVASVLSQEPDGSDWDGPRGLVHTHIAAPPPGGQFLLCGPAPMVEACRDRLRKAGVPDDRIVADLFLPTDR